MTPALETEAPVASTSSRRVQGQAQRTSEEAERSEEPSNQGQRQSQLAQTLPRRVQDPQIGAFSRGQCIQHEQDFDGIHSQRAGKDEQNFSKETIDQIKFVQSDIHVALGKFDANINKITSDISELKEMTKDILNGIKWQMPELIQFFIHVTESKVHVGFKMMKWKIFPFLI
ncbi:hypothetical protein O181_126566 [Austropuccinia psidii MF-1]|uniref:Uncharacterized protein n=1 Tax=Austropuccinia psidii MF-1 TaxID=1389203 RepID=A0A9Q3Q612_9BASI|nr:hypothetical protein [Austropuccinia psidii MF-1]